MMIIFNIEYENLEEFYNWVLKLKPKDLRNKGISQEAFYYLMKTSNYNKAKELANIFAVQSNKYPSWFMNSRQEREIKLHLVKEMLKSGKSPGEAATLIKEVIEKLKRGLRNGTF
ncbi:MAG: hypothetical protein QXQ46_09735 [Thermoplasmatales archaeon]